MTVGPGTVLSSNPSATELIGAALGAALRPGDVIELDGPLGAGKTCLVRGMVAGLGGFEAAVRSPTFVLHQPHRCDAITLHHIDLYRLGEGADTAFLDLEEMLVEGAAVIEWGEYADLRAFRPARVSIAVGADERRQITLDGAVPHLAATWGRLARRRDR